MNAKRSLLALGAVAGLTVLVGCAAPQNGPIPSFAPPTDHVPLNQIVIANQFNTVTLTADNWRSEFAKCVPTAQVNAPSLRSVSVPLPLGRTTTLGHAGSASRFQMTRNVGICIQQSVNNHPIWAAEAFLGTANPKGVPPDVLADWNKQLALKLASSGVVKVAYVSAKNGNAFLVNYWAKDFGTLQYSSQFKKKGEWEQESLDFRFTHPDMNSFSEVKRNGLAEKSPLINHRFLPA